jgi:ring-1,2-phenylacetyl-CoA epoxidase subunit PaaE
MARTQLHTLTVAQVRQEAGAACVQLAVPPELRDTFAFTQGQYLTLAAEVGGQPLRRSYSICSPVHEYLGTGRLEVGIKAVAGGAFSPWACEHLRPGNAVQVMPPQGRFFTPLAASQAKHYLAFAAGSGITPLLSIIATTLATEPRSRFTLVYGNRNVASILFSEALEDLKDRYLGRFNLIHVLSRQHQEVALFNGRIDAAKVQALMEGPLQHERFDDTFICGPNDMIDAVEAALVARGVDTAHIHTERFGTPLPAGASKSSTPSVAGPLPLAQGAAAQLTVVLDGKSYALPLAAGQPVLDAALGAGLDLPYSCKGGVCCTCRAKLVAGTVEMARNFTLEDWEVKQGFVLTCQAHATSPEVVVSFDER